MAFTVVPELIYSTSKYGGNKAPPKSENKFEVSGRTVNRPRGGCVFCIYEGQHRPPLAIESVETSKGRRDLCQKHARRARREVRV
jgi:hypothetical protein